MGSNPASPTMHTFPSHKDTDITFQVKPRFRTFSVLTWDSGLTVLYYNGSMWNMPKTWHTNTTVRLKASSYLCDLLEESGVISRSEARSGTRMAALTEESKAELMEALTLPSQRE